MSGTQKQRLSDAIYTIINEFDDPGRGGLIETPARGAAALQDYFGGYEIDPVAALKCFEDGAEGYDEMVMVKDIPFYSMCEHHLAPFFGRVTIGYIPNGKVVGLSKFSRVIDAYARRLQVQERMTQQIATILERVLNPVGIGVLVRARHLCMESRGICKQGHTTTTQCLLGAMRHEPETRAEFISLAKSDQAL